MAYEGAKRGEGKGTQCSGTNHFLRCVFHLTSFIWMHFQPYIRKIGPKYIRDFFSIRETSYSLRGSGAVNLCVPKFDLNFMRNSFTYKCAQWNKLPEDVKLADNVNIFKSKLRSIQLQFLYFHIYIFVIFIFFYILLYIDLDYIFKFFLNQILLL